MGQHFSQLDISLRTSFSNPIATHQAFLALGISTVFLSAYALAKFYPFSQQTPQVRYDFDSLRGKLTYDSRDGLLDLDSYIKVMKLLNQIINLPKIQKQFAKERRQLLEEDDKDEYRECVLTYLKEIEQEKENVIDWMCEELGLNSRLF